MIAASPDKVWALLTNPATYETWTDARFESADPPGPLRSGQVLHLSSRFLVWRARIRFEVLDADARRHDFQFRGFFPFGLTMHEHISVRGVDGKSRVQYG